MERLSYSLRCALIVDLLNKLHGHGSWCGETHIQKAMYISQDIAKANLGYKFIMYKHGPFSFDLKDELAGMRANGIIEFAFPQQGYGPTIRVTKFGEKIYHTNRENIESYGHATEFVAKWLAASDVRSLERLATAYYVTKKNPRDPIIERAKRIHSLKPHVDIVDAEEAIKIVEQKREQAKREISAAM
jgi:hypothetical protein